MGLLFRIKSPCNLPTRRVVGHHINRCITEVSLNLFLNPDVLARADSLQKSLKRSPSSGHSNRRSGIGTRSMPDVSPDDVVVVSAQ